MVRYTGMPRMNLEISIDLSHLLQKILMIITGVAQPMEGHSQEIREDWTYHPKFGGHSNEYEFSWQ